MPRSKWAAPPEVVPGGPFAIDPTHPTPLLGLLPEWPYPTLCPLSPLPSLPPTAAVDSSPTSAGASPHPVSDPPIQENGSHTQVPILSDTKPLLPHQGAGPTAQGHLGEIPQEMPLEDAWEPQQPGFGLLQSSEHKQLSGCTPGSLPAVAGAPQSQCRSDNMQSDDAEARPAPVEQQEEPERAPEGEQPAELPRRQEAGSSAERDRRASTEAGDLGAPDDLLSGRNRAADERRSEEARHPPEHRGSQIRPHAGRDGSREGGPSSGAGDGDHRHRLTSPDEEELNRRRVRRRPREERLLHGEHHSSSGAEEDRQRRSRHHSWEEAGASGSRSREPSSQEWELRREEIPEVSRAGREAHRGEEERGKHPKGSRAGREAHRGAERRASKGPAHGHEAGESQSRGRDADGEEEWPFDEGRILACNSAMEAEQLGRLRFGSDAARELEGITKRTALFLWNYERGRLHGVFSGTGEPMEPTPRDAVFLYEVPAKNFADYRSLQLDALACALPRIQNGTTHQGKPLLQPLLSRNATARLCCAFARQRRP